MAGASVLWRRTYIMTGTSSLFVGGGCYEVVGIGCRWVDVMRRVRDIDGSWHRIDLLLTLIFRKRSRDAHTSAINNQPLPTRNSIFEFQISLLLLLHTSEYDVATLAIRAANRPAGSPSEVVMIV